MGKGYIKARKTKFKKGHLHSPRTGRALNSDSEVRYVRLEHKMQEKVEQVTVLPEAVTDTENHIESRGGYTFLRAKPDAAAVTESATDKSQQYRQNTDTYKLLHTGKLWEMVNTVVKEHATRTPNCEADLTFDQSTSQQWGLGWRECVHCQTCQYRSRRFKLYKEIDTGKRGAKSATVNRGVCVALTQTPISTSSLRKICLGGNIPAPSAYCLQQNANKVNDIVMEENKKDMKRIREEIKLINTYRNKPQHQVMVQADGMYNNNLYSGVGRTPYQPATQATYIVAETVTKQQQIIAAEAVNKLCSKHGFHTQEDAECDVKCGPCSATACVETTIGDEHRWARECLESLKADGLEVTYLTTDADTGAYRAATDLYNEGITSTVPCHQFDSRHLSENHRKQMRSCHKILSMMPGQTAAYRNYLRGRFALDLSKRCTAEFNSWHDKENGNFLKVREKMKYCVSAVKRCYAGDHCACRLHSLVCKGLLTDNWLTASPFLSRNFRINLSRSENHDAMMQWIEFRLGEDMLEKTRLNSNTQKIEGTNRSIKRSLPKNVTFSRNFPGRLNSAIHSVNNGPGESVRKLCSAAKCPIPETGRVAVQLLEIQRLAEKKKAREATIEFKKKRRKRRSIMYKLHESNRENNLYIKAQLLKNRIRELRKNTSKDRYESPVPSVSTSDHTGYARQLQRHSGKRHAGQCSQPKTPNLKQ